MSNRYHIVFNRPTDLAKVSQAAREGLNPRHSMAVLADMLNAQVHDGSGLSLTLVDNLLGKLTRLSPLWWAIARDLRRKVAPGDVIYCTGEDIGVPVAVVCGTAPGVRVAMMAHYIDRAKGRLALRIFGLKQKVWLYCTVARPQGAFLQRFLGLPPERNLFVWDQTDTHFFTPGPPSPEKHRPIVMSVGLEQRDYGTLAKATADLDLDVKISGYSQDTQVLARAFPDDMPPNMSRRFYTWPDLLQLYRDADVVVVSLFPNSYAAGVQAFMEALACGRPVVVTATEGLEGYLDDTLAMRLVPPGDPDKMREAILDLLANPAESARQGEAAAKLARERHPLEQYVETIAAALARSSTDN